MTKITKNKGGRPLVYTKEIFDEICDLIGDGRSLKSITREERFPAKITFYKWIRKHPELATLYAESRQDRADTLADEILDIADDIAVTGLSSESIQHARLKIDSRKWLACKHYPRTYGDKTNLEHTGKDGAPIKQENKITFDPQQVKETLDKMKEEY